MTAVAKQVSKDRGQPSTVRIGTVTSVDPLLVDVAGTEFSNVGALNGVAPGVGSTVALLGQSAVSADGSSWLVLGQVAQGGAGVAGVRFTSSSTALTWDIAGEFDVPGFSFNATMLPGRLYELRATFGASDNDGGAVYPYIRMYCPNGVVIGGQQQVFANYVNALGGNVITYNEISTWMRFDSVQSGQFRMTAERLFGADELSIYTLENGIFAVFDHGARPEVVDV